MIGVLAAVGLASFTLGVWIARRRMEWAVCGVGMGRVVVGSTPAVIVEADRFEQERGVLLRHLTVPPTCGNCVFAGKHEVCLGWSPTVREPAAITYRKAPPSGCPIRMFHDDD